MIRLHTAQLNVGKCIPRNGNVVFLDTTVRSGNDLVKENIAPTWDMVRAFKAGELSEIDYTGMYLDRVRAMNDICIHQFEKLAQGEGGITDVIIGCYCSAGTFCHRHVLQKYLCKQYGFIKGWEVSRDMVTSSEMPNRSVISITDPGSRTEEDIKRILSDELSAGELRIIDRASVDIGISLPATAHAYDQALTGFISLSRLFQSRSTDKHNGVTCIDITFLTSSMYEVDFLERGGDYLSHVRATTTIGGLVGEHFMGQRSWHIVKITDDMTDKQVLDMIRKRGYTSLVTIGGA